MDVNCMAVAFQAWFNFTKHNISLSLLRNFEGSHFRLKRKTSMNNVVNSTEKYESMRL